jgi:hypothetical protein
MTPDDYNAQPKRHVIAARRRPHSIMLKPRPRDTSHCNAARPHDAQSPQQRRVTPND